MTAAELAQGLMNDPLAEVFLIVNGEWVKVLGVRRVQGRHNAVTFVMVPTGVTSFDLAADIGDLTR